jgi:Ras family protein A
LKSSFIELVKTEDGEKMAKRIGAHAFFECSSKTSEGVREVFEGAARASLLDKSYKKRNENRLRTILQRCTLI